jgi:hypothetical protein
MIMKNSAGLRQINVLALYRGVSWPPIMQPGTMMPIRAKSSAPFPFTGQFNRSIISPPPNWTVYFQATLADGNQYEYGYAFNTDAAATLAQDSCNAEAYLLAQGPTPIGGEYFNPSKLGGAYYKIQI